MKGIFLKTPSDPSTWPQSASSWKNLWKRIGAELKTVPLSDAKGYFADSGVEVWVWCHGKNAAGEIEYRVWCFTPDEDEPLGGELWPMDRKKSRIWNRHLRVWIDLEYFSILHCGGFGGEQDEHLEGEGLRGRELPVMDF